MAEQSREEEILRSIIDDTEYNKTPQSRNEEILVSIINETEYTKTPQSREEELLLELKEKIEGGGGGGGTGIKSISTIQHTITCSGGIT